MNRIAVLLVMAMFGLATTAGAQVATTDLVPFAPRMPGTSSQGTLAINVVPDNPAAMQWGERSVIGAATADGTTKLVVTGLLSEEVTTGGTFFGARWTGEWLSLGAEKADIDQESAPLALNAATEEDTVFGAGVKVFDFLAIGASGHKNELDVPIATTHESISSTTIGLSLNIAEWLYIGVGQMSQEGEFDDGVVPTITAERDTDLFGVAVRTTGEWRWYLAYDEIKQGESSVPLGTGFSWSVNLTSRAKSIQTNYAGFLIGYSVIDYDSNDLPTGFDYQREEFDLGYAPAEGVSILFRHQTLILIQPGGFTTDFSRDIDSLALAWSF